MDQTKIVSNGQVIKTNEFSWTYYNDVIDDIGKVITLSQVTQVFYKEFPIWKTIIPFGTIQISDFDKCLLTSLQSNLTLTDMSMIIGETKEQFY